MINAKYINISDKNPVPLTEATLGYNTLDYIPFGSDNLFPQSLALFSRVSPNHRGILNSKAGYIMSDGITSEDDQLIDELDTVNFQGEGINDVVKKLNIDDLRFGNYWLELISDRNHSFVWFNHLDSTKCRLTKDKKGAIIHPDWRVYRPGDKYRKVIPLYPNWVKDEDSDGFPAYRSVIHSKDYEPEFVYYGLPDYIAAKDSVQIDFSTNKWNLARLKNSFRISGMLIVPVKDEIESKAVIDYVEKELIGEGNQAKLLTITKTRAQETEKADQTQFIETKQDDKGSWMDLHKQSTGDMIVAHKWFRSLAGLADNTGFDTQRILNEYEMALNGTIKDYQKKYIGQITKIYADMLGRDIEIKFVNRPPFDTDNYKYIWELRAEKGLPFDESDPAQQIIVMDTGTNKGTANG